MSFLHGFVVLKLPELGSNQPLLEWHIHKTQLLIVHNIGHIPILVGRVLLFIGFQVPSKSYNFVLKLFLPNRIIINMILMILMFLRIALGAET